MYNGIGLATSRGSGTNGYVTRNMAYINPNKMGGPQQRSQNSLFPDENKAKLKKANPQILEHERKRKVEAELFELKFKLQDEGKTEDEIDSIITLKRTELYSRLERDSSDNLRAKRQLGTGDALVDSHEAREAQERKNDAFRNAMRLERSATYREDVTESEMVAFNPELKQKLKQEIHREREERRQALERRDAEEKHKREKRAKSYSSDDDRSKKSKRHDSDEDKPKKKSRFDDAPNDEQEMLKLMEERKAKEEQARKKRARSYSSSSSEDSSDDERRSRSKRQTDSEEMPKKKSKFDDAPDDEPMTYGEAALLREQLLLARLKPKESTVEQPTPAEQSKEEPQAKTNDSRSSRDDYRERRRDDKQEYPDRRRDDYRRSGRDYEPRDSRRGDRYRDRRDDYYRNDRRKDDRSPRRDERRRVDDDRGYYNKFREERSAREEAKDAKAEESKVKPRHDSPEDKPRQEKKQVKKSRSDSSSDSSDISSDSSSDDERRK
jgi:hypothetical protein